MARYLYALFSFRGVTYDAVKLGTLVALGTANVALGLARAELAEILSSLGNHVLEELKGDTAKRLAWGVL